MKKTQKPVAYETNRKIRRDWGEISPCTKIIRNKKHEKIERAKRKEEY